MPLVDEGAALEERGERLAAVFLKEEQARGVLDAVAERITDQLQLLRDLVLRLHVVLGEDVDEVHVGLAVELAVGADRPDRGAAEIPGERQVVARDLRVAGVEPPDAVCLLLATRHGRRAGDDLVEMVAEVHLGAVVAVIDGEVIERLVA